VREWRAVALSPDVGLLSAELDEFAPAFEHADMNAARELSEKMRFRKVSN
jgi:serine/threonine-protein kinase HipA